MVQTSVQSNRPSGRVGGAAHSRGQASALCPSAQSKRITIFSSRTSRRGPAAQTPRPATRRAGPAAGAWFLPTRKTRVKATEDCAVCRRSRQEPRTLLCGLLMLWASLAPSWRRRGEPSAHSALVAPPSTFLPLPCNRHLFEIIQQRFPLGARHSVSSAASRRLSRPGQASGQPVSALRGASQAAPPWPRAWRSSCLRSWRRRLERCAPGGLPLHQPARPIAYLSCAFDFNRGGSCSHLPHLKPR